MMKDSITRWCAVLMISLLSLSAQAQEKITIEQATPGSKEYAEISSQLLADSSVYPSWMWSSYKLSEGFDLKSVSGTVLATAPDKSFVVLGEGENISLMKRDGVIIPISRDGSFDIVYGQSVHRNEFGIEGGVFISPDARYVAFYRNDQSHVQSYPIVALYNDIARHQPIKYPMAGRKSEHVTVGIYDVERDAVRYLNTGEPEDRFFTNVAWSPDSQSLIIDEVNREQNETQLVEYSIITGEPLNTLLVERNPKYIEPRMPIQFLKDGRFLRVSRVDGFNHIYLYSREGKLLRQLTKGNWEVVDYMGLSPDEGYVFFTSNKDYLIGQDLYRASLKKGEVERLTEGNGWHSVRISPDFTEVVDHFSNIDTPNVVNLIKIGRKVERHEIFRAEDPLNSYERPVVELGSIESKSGFDLYYKLTRPAVLEEGKKYPVVVYVYGGPHSQLVTDTWRGLNMGWDVFMAQQGYVVFTLDNRGTSNRGFDFEGVIHRQLGTPEIEDQMQGIDYLRSLPYVDGDKIGVYGWSFGGFMTTNLMLTHPETFKVGVAGGPVMDWSYYEIMYGERYMDTPQTNPEGYAKNRLTDRAGDLEGRLLLIHGAIDPVVVWQHSLRFVEEAIKVGKLVDYMIYPKDEHNVRGQDRVHLHRTICRYFDDHLK